MAKEQRYLTINEAISQDPKAPLWLINVADESQVTDFLGADVLLTARSEGDVIPIDIPKTWLPHEVTNKAPREAILKSRYFLDAVREGLVRIITAEYAAELETKKGADEERERLKAREDQRLAATSNRRNEDMNAPKEKTISTEDIEEVPIQFKALVNKMNMMKLSEAVNELRSRRRLPISQLEYLRDNTKHKKIAEWITKQLEDGDEEE